MSLPANVLEWHRAGRPEVPALHDDAVPGPRLCPSYPDGLGGRPFAIRIDDSALEFCEAKEIGVPVSKVRVSVRLAGPCITARCVHWSGHCNLGAVLSRSISASAIAGQEAASSDGECGIVDTCRWRAENGQAACMACVGVDYLMS